MSDQNSSPPNKRHFFCKDQRVRKGVEFSAVYGSKLFAADGTLVINAVKRQEDSCISKADGPARIGLSISKKVGNAPTRNKWKRQIRQAFRMYQHRIPKGWDFVVRPKKDASFDPKAIQKSLPRLIKKVLQKAKITESKRGKKQDRADGK